MLNNPLMADVMAKYHREQLLLEAEQARLTKRVARETRTAYPDRRRMPALLPAFGDLLVRLGGWVAGRQQPTVTSLS
jgi:hypothetical protein